MRLFVWFGGALFLTAVGLTGWTYAVTFGRDLPYRGLRPVVVNAALFSCFALHHTGFARDGAKALVARLLPLPLRRSAYVWIASLLLITVLVAWRPVGGSLYAIDPPLAWLCLAVQAAGVWFTIRGAQAIDPLELAGIRDQTLAVTLQVHGPYRLVRHPLYLGWLLMVFGTPHMTGDRLVFAAVSSTYLAIAIPFEERSLRRLFGPEYERYQARVRWRMLPYVY